MWAIFEAHLREDAHCIQLLDVLHMFVDEQFSSHGRREEKHVTPNSHEGHEINFKYPAAKSSLVTAT
jgi:hypothetical protein